MYSLLLQIRVVAFQPRWQPHSVSTPSPAVFPRIARLTAGAMLGCTLVLRLAAPSAAVPLHIQRFIAADNEYYGFPAASLAEVGKQTDRSLDRMLADLSATGLVPVELKDTQTAVLLHALDTSTHLDFPTLAAAFQRAFRELSGTSDAARSQFYLDTAKWIMYWVRSTTTYDPFLEVEDNVPRFDALYRTLQGHERLPGRRRTVVCLTDVELTILLWNLIGGPEEALTLVHVLENNMGMRFRIEQFWEIQHVAVLLTTPMTRTLFNFGLAVTFPAILLWAEDGSAHEARGRALSLYPDLHGRTLTELEEDREQLLAIEKIHQYAHDMVSERISDAALRSFYPTTEKRRDLRKLQRMLKQAARIAFGKAARGHPTLALNARGAQAALTGSIVDLERAIALERGGSRTLTRTPE